MDIRYNMKNKLPASTHSIRPFTPKRENLVPEKTEKESFVLFKKMKQKAQDSLIMVNLQGSRIKV